MYYQGVQITALSGLLLSIYTFNVDNKIKKDKSYKPICDISSSISCTKAFSSSYSKTFGIPNSIGGIIFYTAILVLSFFQISDAILYLSIASVLGSLYLSYISYFKLKNFCLICSMIYAVNILLLVFSLI